MKIQDRQPHFVYLQTQPLLPAICHHCEKDKQNKQRRSRSSYPFRSQSQTPLSLYNLPPYTPAIIPGFVKTNGLCYGL
jgi:hypothetical protein